MYAGVWSKADQRPMCITTPAYTMALLCRGSTACGRNGSIGQQPTTRRCRLRSSTLSLAVEACAEAWCWSRPGHLAACFQSHVIGRETGVLHERSGRAAGGEGIAHALPVTEGIMARRLAMQDGIDFTVHRGETPAWSARAARRPVVASCGWKRPPPGELHDGVDVAKMERKELLALRRRIQVIISDPYSSLNPRM